MGVEDENCEWEFGGSDRCWEISSVSTRLHGTLDRADEL
jgi:hypothetical protein